ncbi:hypothetical protein EUGRSUZ_C03941 [Eucalyptus grandis]|uniref:Uncharacterized protein n=2 Tax=Eucalyptus grandis TaxID=71139 RepID=A0ACC3LJF4_EUCGR|nr:hypothetical protein EUGRSUZ_C03941 [Eucalyptus grandis]
MNPLFPSINIFRPSIFPGTLGRAAIATKPLPPMAPSPSPSSSLSPPPVPMELHVRNRDKLLKSLRQSLRDAGRPLHGFVFLQGGGEQARHDTDHTELFRCVVVSAIWFG